MNMGQIKGNILKLRNGCKSYEIKDASPAILFKIMKILKDKFGFNQVKRPVSAEEETIAIYAKNKITFLVGWDKWTGFYLSATDIQGNNIIDDIAGYLNGQLNNAEFKIFKTI